MRDMNNLVKFFKIGSDEMRLRIILLLSKRTLCGCQLCEILDLSQPRVAQHLGKLRDLGIVQDNRRGKWVIYQLQVDDVVINQFINSIISNIERYPILMQDAERLSKIQECD